jgi:hypothetical protein
MLRALGLFGLAGLFLTISPQLRYQLGDGVARGVAFLDAHSPYSYIATGLAFLGVVALMARSAFACR